MVVFEAHYEMPRVGDVWDVDGKLRLTCLGLNDAARQEEKYSHWVLHHCQRLLIKLFAQLQDCS